MTSDELKEIEARAIVLASGEKLHVADSDVTEKLIQAVRERDARIEKALKLIKTSIVVEHDCEECGNHTGVRYEIKELVEARKAIAEYEKGRG